MRFVLDGYYEHRLKTNTLDVTQIEQLSWDQQRKEADAYTADNSASTPLLTKLAEARGISVADMVIKVNNAIDGYYDKMRQGESPKQLSKEFVRQWLIENGFQGKEGEEVPYMSPEHIDSISERYIELYEHILGEKFIKEDNSDAASRIENNILSYLSEV